MMTPNNLNLNHWSSVRTTPYQLSTVLHSSDSFYLALDQFTQKVQEKGRAMLGLTVKRFRHSVAYLKTDPLQGYEETLLDLLIMGVFWNEYKGRWGNSSIVLKEKGFNQLYAMRTKHEALKPVVDHLRGKLGAAVLDKPSKAEVEFSLRNLRWLNKWLSATNEFNEEVTRISIWIEFLSTLPERATQLVLMDVAAFASWFKREAKSTLGRTTQRVDAFRAENRIKRRGQENYFFTGRAEVEYHLNMVGATILNESFKVAFQNTEFQVLLLPSCMARSRNCKAVEVKHGTICQNCTSNCSISRTSKEMMERGVHTFIVKHSTGYSRYLKRWANQQKVGLIGTACVLNLISGGYAMKRLNIPAQCIFLDYSGCKKHWSDEDIPTAICDSKVQSLVAVERSQAI